MKNVRGVVAQHHLQLHLRLSLGRNLLCLDIGIVVRDGKRILSVGHPRDSLVHQVQSAIGLFHLHKLDHVVNALGLLLSCGRCRRHLCCLYLQ